MRQWENKNRTCGMEHRYGLYLSYTLASANPQQRMVGHGGNAPP